MGSAAAAVRDLQDASDAALALARGREDALAELYRRYVGSGRAAACRMLLSPGLAGGTVQDVFLQLWSAPERFDPERKSLRAYLHGRAYRRAIDASRSEFSRKRREEQEVQRRPSLASDLVEEVIIGLTMARQVRWILAGLAVRQRQAIELAFVSGYSSGGGRPPRPARGDGEELDPGRYPPVAVAPAPRLSEPGGLAEFLCVPQRPRRPHQGTAAVGGGDLPYLAGACDRQPVSVALPATVTAGSTGSEAGVEREVPARLSCR